MNKSELVDMMSELSGMTKVDCNKALDAFMQSVEKILKKGGDLRLVGFGTFSVVKREAKNGRNPKTGKLIRIEASNRPKFKPGKGLIDAVN